MYGSIINAIVADGYATTAGETVYYLYDLHIKPREVLPLLAYGFRFNTEFKRLY